MDPLDDLDPNFTVSQGSVIQPQWITGPWKTHDGYKGSSEHFGVKLNVIKIKNTDAIIGHMPSEEQRQLSVDEDGIFSRYELQNAGDNLYQSWMHKIGPYLADWALGLPRRGAFFLQLFTPQVCADNMACVTREPPMEAPEIPR
jgi:hypothetical protein